jgi:predicted DNA-binding transcriptional regulator AlpA
VNKTTTFKEERQTSMTPKMKMPRPRKTSKATPAEALADLSLATDTLLSTADAARLVGLSAKTLRQLRCDKSGPRCLKLGTKKQSRTVYRRSDLERWIRSCVVTVTGS